MSINLPIPEIKIIEKEFYWVPFDTSEKCIKHKFIIKSHDEVKTLRKYIGNSFDKSPDSFEILII